MGSTVMEPKRVGPGPLMQFAERVRQFDPTSDTVDRDRVALLAAAKGLPRREVMSILAHRVAFLMRVEDAGRLLDRFESDLDGAE